MKRLILPLALILISCAPQSATEDALSRWENELMRLRGIRFGQEVVLTNYPAVVGIQNGGGICTGTFIGTDLVLTAAHCVGPSAQMQVFRSDGTFTQVVDTRVHADWDSAGGIFYHQGVPYAVAGNDVALLKVEDRPTQQYRSLSDTPLVPGEDYRIVGFGKDEHEIAGVKRIGFMTFIAQVPTANHYPLDIIHPFGAFGMRASVEQTACQGDSGGPLFDSSGALAGITSVGLVGPQGMECSGALNATYLRLAPLRNVIAQWAEELSGPLPPTYSWTHPVDPNDVNGDGRITLADAVAVVAFLRSNGPQPIRSHERPDFYLDVDNNGLVTVADAVAIVATLRHRGPYQY